EDADPRVAGADLALATAAMNAQVEQIARRDLRQYQWTYKRFSRRPPGSNLKNPYRPDCY
ncbi:MAG: lauroyl acyltransferase, partial [Arenimonas sp.]